jgi:phage/plasmid-like protein (TIGR03299 family)
MAHLVETMAYVGSAPWHGLGNQLTENQPIEVWAKEAGMDWSIREAPVRFIAGNDAYTGSIMTFPENKVLFRSDTNAPLSVVSQRYQVVQPREILEFYRDLTKVSGFELETAGVLKGGKKFWALAKTGQDFALRGNDVTNGYILLATACDGTLATTAQFTSIRVVCNNTLAVALADGCKSAVKVPHNTTFDAQAVKKQLGISVSSWDHFMYSMKTLSERKVKGKEAQNFFLRVFTDQGKPSVGTSNERSMSKALELFEGRGRGADLDLAKGTAFGLLNAVTEFVDHERKARNTDNRLDSAWFGQGANIKQKALEQALLMAA